MKLMLEQDYQEDMESIKQKVNMYFYLMVMTILMTTISHHFYREQKKQMRILFQAVSKLSMKMVVGKQSLMAMQQQQVMKKLVAFGVKE